MARDKRRYIISVTKEMALKIKFMLEKEDAFSAPELIRRIISDYYKKHYYDKRLAVKRETEVVKEKLTTMTVEQLCESVQDTRSHTKGVVKDGNCVIKNYITMGTEAGKGILSGGSSAWPLTSFRETFERLYMDEQVD